MTPSLHSFIPDISIAPLKVNYYSTTQRHSQLQHWYYAKVNTLKRYSEWRTCPRSLCGG